MLHVDTPVVAAAIAVLAAAAHAEGALQARRRLQVGALWCRRDDALVTDASGLGGAAICAAAKHRAIAVGHRHIASAVARLRTVCGVGAGVTDLGLTCPERQGGEQGPGSGKTCGRGRKTRHSAVLVSHRPSCNLRLSLARAAATSPTCPGCPATPRQSARLTWRTPFSIAPSQWPAAWFPGRGSHRCGSSRAVGARRHCCILRRRCRSTASTSAQA